MPAQLDRHYLKTRPSRLWSRLVSYVLYEGRPLTTRGRWINPIVFANYALARKLPQLKTVEQPLFILGTGRSGTTILGVVLSMHRDVGFLNEPKAAWHAAHGDEDLIGSYSRSETARYRLEADDADPKTIKALRRIYGAYLRVSNTRCLVDKYPELIFRFSFVKAIFPDAKFLFLARDGWDTCASIENWSKRLGVETKDEVHDWWGADNRKWSLLLDQIVPEHADLAPHIKTIRALSDQRDRAAVEWIVTMREGLSLIEQYPDDVLHVPYEEMCRAPRAWMDKISAFGSLREDEVFLKYAEEKLSPVNPRQPFDLDPVLLPAFKDTMERLGYGGRVQL